jgi:hypothetical protein
VYRVNSTISLAVGATITHGAGGLGGTSAGNSGQQGNSGPMN